MSNQKAPYVCSPSPIELQLNFSPAKRQFHSNIADICENVFGVRAFVPHEYFNTDDVLDVKRLQIENHTSLLIVVLSAPMWDAGAEVEMASEINLPMVILKEDGKDEGSLPFSATRRCSNDVHEILHRVNLGPHPYENALCLLAAKLAEIEFSIRFPLIWLA